MSMRERMLAVIGDGAPDRVPFVQYSGMAAPNEEVWAKIGSENIGVLTWCSAHRFERPHCRIEQEDISRNGRRGRRNTMVTPVGSLTEEKLLVPDMGGVTGFAKHYVETIDDYKGKHSVNQFSGG